MVEWLDGFQAQVNKLTESEHLKFTLDIWNPDSPEEETSSNKRVTINRNSAFPYLDMEFYWLQDKLQFRVHLKPNQLLKYLNKGSTHTNSCFSSIPHGVIRRLTTLTSITQDNKSTRINELYPHHALALEKAGLITPAEYPTLQESFDQIEQQKIINKTQTEQAIKDQVPTDQAKKDRDKARTIWLCASYSRIWGKPLHARVKRLRDKYKLSWLRISMSYSRFTNLGQKWNSDLTGKIMDGIHDKNL